MNNLIFLPVVIQVLLVFSLYIYLAIVKSRAIKAGQVDEKRRSLHDDAWPDYVLKVNNNIRNQFEVPVLFYVLVMLVWLTQSVNIVMHILAWVFVASRIHHSIIHVGSNHVPLRRRVFMFGCLILIIITLYLAYSIILGQFQS
jgi:hypothetical protein